MNKLNNVSLTVSTNWVKKNDEDLFYYLRDIMEDFVTDEQNACNEEDLQSFDNGNWQVEYLFRNGEVTYTAGRDGQHLANQDGWTRDKISDIEPEKIKLYESMV